MKYNIGIQEVKQLHGTFHDMEAIEINQLMVGKFSSHKSTGLATLCVGGGMGIATNVELV